MSAWIKVNGAQNDGIFRHAVTGKYMFRKYREGHGEIKRSLKTTDITFARRERDKIMQELWGDQPKIQRRHTMGELWAVWREGKANSKALRKATLDSIDSSWKNLEPYMGDLFPDDITEDFWLNNYIPRKRAEVSLRTGVSNPGRKFMNERKWLVALLNHLFKKGVIRKVPEIINPDPARDRAEVFTEDEFARLLDCADWSLMTKLVMGRDHFMRRSEIAFMTWDRVDLEKRSVHLRAQDTKIKRERTFPMNEALCCLLSILKAEQEKAGICTHFVFPSPGDPNRSILRDGFNKSWATCKRVAKVPAQKKFHWLRHTGLTMAFRRQKIAAAQICFFAGLSLEVAQEVYLHFELDDLRGVENLVGLT